MDFSSRPLYRGRTALRDSEVTRYANQVKALRGPLVYLYSVIHTLVTLAGEGAAASERNYNVYA